MRKYTYKIGLVGIVLAFVAASVPTALALPSQADSNSHATSSSTTTSTDHATDATGEAKGQAKLTETRLRVCQRRQKAITNTMTRIADRGQKRLRLFDAIASRVEAFYVKKGKTLSNYNALVVATNTKRTEAQTAINKITADATSFHCDGTNPMGVVSSFKTDLKAEISALHEYHKAVRNLTVGVKSVQSTTKNQTSGGGNQ